MKDTTQKALLCCSALCVIAALAAGCTQSATTEQDATGTATATAPATTTAPAAPATNAPAADPTITIADNSFGDPVTVAPGAQITVTNDDSAEHSVTSRSAGAFDVHVDGGQQATLTAPAEPGEYAFYCIHHPSMTGTLIVE